MFRVIRLFWVKGNQAAADCARKAEKHLTEKGITVLCDDTRPERPPELVITFGGDGTLLSGARVALRYDIPLVGINLGTVGFLTEEEPGRLTEALDKILEGKYRIEERSLLEALHVRTGKTSVALNDIVMTRGGFARLIRVECRVNDEEYGSFTADGLIVATPTGSTGYSLSAGGPIVEPDMSCMIITPVCAHSLQHYSGVVSDRSVIRLYLSKEKYQSAMLQVDGQNMEALQPGDEVIIQGAGQRIRLLRLYPYQFFTVIRKKLSEWGSQA